jgi:prepilin-type N-terminal cleavage/methylation domain-containing protein
LLHGRQGFTTIELLTVIIIVAILAVLAAPSFMNFNQTYRVTAFAQDLLYNLQYARSLAIENDQNVYVTFNSNSGDYATAAWCYGINLGAACDCTGAGGTGAACSNGVFSDPRVNDTILSATSTLASGTNTGSLIFEGTRGATASPSSATTFSYYPAGSSASTGPTMSLEVTTLGNMQMCSSTISGYSGC